MIWGVLSVIIVIVAFLIGCVCFSKNETEEVAEITGDNFYDSYVINQHPVTLINDGDKICFDTSNRQYKYISSSGTEKTFVDNQVRTDSGVKICLKVNTRRKPNFEYGFFMALLALVVVLFVVFFHELSDNKTDDEKNYISEQNHNEQGTDDPEQKDDGDDPESTFEIKEYVDSENDEMSFQLNYNWDEYSTNEYGLRLDEAQSLLPGVTVSYFQGEIDWKKLREQGVHYAIVRLGYRGYESGENHLDKNYEEYMDGAIKENVKTSVYYFSQAITAKEVDEEIDFILDNIETYKDDFSGIIGVNLGRNLDENQVSFRTDCLSNEEYIYLTKYYCIKIKEAGYTPVIFETSDNLKAIYENYGENVYSGFLLWLYDSDNEVKQTENLVFWQYRNYFRIDGVQEKTQVFFGNIEDIR